MQRNLSKSKYLAGLQCEKRLWLEINDPVKASPVSESQQRLFDQGKEIGDRSVFQIPNLSIVKKMSLRERGILLIDHIPHDYPLAYNQRNYVNRRLTGRTYMNKSVIRGMLSRLEFPIHFLDFEADNPAVPRLHGMRPFQLIVFQLSCHILNEDGGLEHFEYLHADMSDPRESVIERLINIVNKKGNKICQAI